MKQWNGAATWSKMGVNQQQHGTMCEELSSSMEQHRSKSATAWNNMRESSREGSNDHQGRMGGVKERQEVRWT
eukprot:1151315-Pelagomonas_calceolata.AAC.8